MQRRNTVGNSKSGAESGFTLVEAIITMVIFLLVMSAIFGVLRAGNLMRDNVEDRSEVVANARTAMNFLGKEAVNAGLGYSKIGGVVPDDFAYDLLKIPKDTDFNRDIFPGVVAGNNISASDLSLTGEKNDVIAFVSRDMQFNSGEPVTIIDYGVFNWSPYLTTEPLACSDCRTYDVYLIESPNGTQALAMATLVKSSTYITLNEGDPLGLNRFSSGAGSPTVRSILKECGPSETANCFDYTPHATLKRVFITAFSVNVEGDLIRTVYGNNVGGTAAEQIQVQPLASGVQSFQVRYLMQDGTISEDPSEGNTNQMRQNEVVQVELSITIKSENDKNGVTSTQFMTLDSTFSTRNLRYDFE